MQSVNIFSIYIYIPSWQIECKTWPQIFKEPIEEQLSHMFGLFVCLCVFPENKTTTETSHYSSISNELSHPAIFLKQEFYRIHFKYFNYESCYIRMWLSRLTVSNRNILKATSCAPRSNFSGLSGFLEILWGNFYQFLWFFKRCSLI